LVIQRLARQISGLNANQLTEARGIACHGPMTIAAGKQRRTSIDSEPSSKPACPLRHPNLITSLLLPRTRNPNLLRELTVWVLGHTRKPPRGAWSVQLGGHAPRIIQVADKLDPWSGAIERHLDRLKRPRRSAMIKCKNCPHSLFRGSRCEREN